MWARTYHIYIVYWAHAYYMCIVKNCNIHIYIYIMFLLGVWLLQCRPRSVITLMWAHTCVAACCSVLQCITVCFAVCCRSCHTAAMLPWLYDYAHVSAYLCCNILQCVAVHYSVLQCITVCCSDLQCVVGLILPLQCRPRSVIRLIWAHMRVYACVCMYACACACVCACMCACVCGVALDLWFRSCERIHIACL